MNSVTLKVDGMSCGHCVKAIEGALKNINVIGIVNLENKTVQVNFNEITTALDTIKNAIEDQGYVVK